LGSPQKPLERAAWTHYFEITANRGLYHDAWVHPDATTARCVIFDGRIAAPTFRGTEFLDAPGRHKAPPVLCSALSINNDCPSALGHPRWSPDLRDRSGFPSTAVAFLLRAAHTATSMGPTKPSPQW
jgi:hypothetical protein